MCTNRFPTIHNGIQKPSCCHPIPCRISTTRLPTPGCLPDAFLIVLSCRVSHDVPSMQRAMPACPTRRTAYAPPAARNPNAIQHQSRRIQQPSGNPKLAHIPIMHVSLVAGWVHWRSSRERPIRTSGSGRNASPETSLVGQDREGSHCTTALSCTTCHSRFSGSPSVPSSLFPSLLLARNPCLLDRC